MFTINIEDSTLIVPPSLYTDTYIHMVFFSNQLYKFSISIVPGFFPAKITCAEVSSKNLAMVHYQTAYKVCTTSTYMIYTIDKQFRIRLFKDVENFTLNNEG